MPDGVDIALTDAGWCLLREGKPFARIFRIDMTPSELHTLVVGLSNHLAQPVQESWDGVTITTLVA